MSAEADLEPTLREHAAAMLTQHDELIRLTAKNYATFREHGLPGPAKKVLKALTQLHQGRSALVDVQEDPFLLVVGDMRIVLGQSDDHANLEGEDRSKGESNVISFEAWRARELRALDEMPEHSTDGVPER